MLIALLLSYTIAFSHPQQSNLDIPKSSVVHCVRYSYYENDCLLPCPEVNVQGSLGGAHLARFCTWLDRSRASLARILGLKYLVHLLERAALGLNKEEVDDDELEHIPEHKEGVAA